LFPKSALSFEEESWNSYPYTRTKYKHRLFKSFNIDIESKYLPDLGQTENAFNLSKTELAMRTIDYIDILNDVININEYKVADSMDILKIIESHHKNYRLKFTFIVITSALLAAVPNFVLIAVIFNAYGAYQRCTPTKAVTYPD
jgi:hypothetical protein